MSEAKSLKTLTINGIKYKVKGQDSLSCGDLHLTSDSNGIIDTTPLFNNNYVLNEKLNEKLEEFAPYKLSPFQSGDSLEIGQIKSMTLTSDPDPEQSIIVNLDFGNSVSAAADALLWIDASDESISSDANLAVVAADTGITYEIVGDNKYQTATHGKKCLFCFTRITQYTVIANKREY